MPHAASLDVNAYCAGMVDGPGYTSMPWISFGSISSRENPQPRSTPSTATRKTHGTRSSRLAPTTGLLTREDASINTPALSITLVPTARRTMSMVRTDMRFSICSRVINVAAPVPRRRRVSNSSRNAERFSPITRVVSRDCTFRRMTSATAAESSAAGDEMRTGAYPGWRTSNTAEVVLATAIRVYPRSFVVQSRSVTPSIVTRTPGSPACVSSSVTCRDTRRYAPWAPASGIPAPRTTHTVSNTQLRARTIRSWASSVACKAAIGVTSAGWLPCGTGSQRNVWKHAS